MRSLYVYSKPRNFGAININNIYSNLGIDNDTPSTSIHVLGSTPIVRVDEDGTNYTDLNQGVWMYGTHTTWEDLRTPLTQTKLGSNLKPEFDQTNVGYLFPQNNADEILYLITQLPHQWKEGSNINPHVHWQQSANNNVTFKIDYKWIDVGKTVPDLFTTLIIDQPYNSYESGNIHQISQPSNMISGTGHTVSSMLLIKLYRDDNDYSGDVLAWDFDIHYQIESLGTREEYYK